MKKCTKCNKIKALEDFPVRKEMKDGRHSHCKSCRSDYDKRKYNPLQRKELYLKDHTKSKEERRQYYSAN